MDAGSPRRARVSLGVISMHTPRRWTWTRAHLIGATVLLLAGVACTQAASGTDRPVEILIEDYRFDPESVVIPADEPVTLEFVNTNDFNYCLTVGRGLVEDEGRVVGHVEDLLTSVDVNVDPRTSLIDPTEQIATATLDIPAASTVRVELTVPSELAGRWTVGCFIGPGCDYRVGLSGELIVE